MSACPARVARTPTRTMSCSTSHAGCAARAFARAHASRAGGTDARVPCRASARRRARFEVRATDAAASPAPPPPRGRVSARWIIDTRYGHKASAISLLGEWIHTVGAEAGLDASRVSVFTGQLGCPESRVEMHCEQFDDLAELDAFFAALPSAKHRAWGEKFAEHVVDGSPTWHVLRAVPVALPQRATEDAERRSKNVSPAAPSGGSKKKTFPNETEKSLSFVDDAADVAAAVAAAAAFDVTYNSGGLIDGLYAVEEQDVERVTHAVPPRTKPRAPRSLTKEQSEVPVYAIDDFGDAAGETSLVFPPSDDKNDVDGVDLSEFEPGSKVVMDWKGEPMVIRPGDKLPNVQ